MKGKEKIFNKLIIRCLFFNSHHERIKKTVEYTQMCRNITRF